MSNQNFFPKPFIFFAAFIVLIVLLTFIFFKLIKSWRFDIIEGRKILTEVVVEKLNKSAESFLDSLNNVNFFESDTLTKKYLDIVDVRLKQITEQELSHVPGTEGGFYFDKLSDFYGYAFPTSPPPKPAFGPPPRSYDIIKNQVTASIEKDSFIVNLHSFDPAVFPLASKPIKINNMVIGAAWVRIHIERDLPSLNLSQILQIAGIFSFIGFVITIVATLRMRKNMETIKSGLQKLETDTTFRFGRMSGVFNLIGGEINKLVSQINDAHEQKQSLEKELNQQDKLATLGKLIAGVAHEVKTPLAIIKTRIQIWQSTLKNKADKDINGVISQEAMQLVVNEIDRLAKLVKRLLVFSKPVSEKFQHVNISKLITQIISLVQIDKGENIKFSTSLDENIPLIKCDQTAIEQVLINILNNSIEAFNGQGTIEITTSYNKQLNNLTLEITDDGLGIPADIQDKIFDPFFTTKQSGVGLGLSIAYEIIKAHKGKIHFSNRKPKGTSCIIELNIL